MRTQLLFVSATLALLSAVAAPAEAQLLGGGVRGGAAGSFGSPLGGARASEFERAHAAARTNAVKKGTEAGARAGSHVAADGHTAAGAAASEGRNALNAGASAAGSAAANAAAQGQSAA